MYQTWTTIYIILYMFMCRAGHCIHDGVLKKSYKSIQKSFYFKLSGPVGAHLKLIPIYTE